MKHWQVYFFIGLYSFCSSCCNKHAQKATITHTISAQEQSAAKQSETWIIVFVHGIMSVKPHLTTANFLRFMTDMVHNTTYWKTVELMRNDPHFCKNQAMQGLGLQKIDCTDITKGNASAALAQIFNTITEHNYPDRTIDSHYYTFGWTALLSPKQRYLDAKELFIALEKKRAEFQEKGITPKIKVIGYSHGGNVILNLGAVHEREFPTSSLAIDETLLLGMPVQKETDDLINDSVFKKVYHIYSCSDHIQKLDFFSFKRFFSRRIFKKRGKRIHLPKKLVQIRLKLTRPSKKTRKNSKPFKHSFDFSNSAILSGKSSLLRESSPGHAELWFFGWSPKDYRSTFALAPLPSISVAPFLMCTLEKLDQNTDPTIPVVIDVRPEHGIAVIKNVKGKRFYAIESFLPPHVFQELRQLAFSYKPDGYSGALYEQHIQKAFSTAKKYYQENWSKSPHRVRRRKKRAKLASQQAARTIARN